MSFSSDSTAIGNEFLSQLQFYSKYSRIHIENGKAKLEVWEQTVDRIFRFFETVVPAKVLNQHKSYLKKLLCEKKILPSMRLLAMADFATDESHIGIYNCSYIAVKNIECFHDAFVCMLWGCGVGFSVESQYVNNLPIVPMEQVTLSEPYVIVDSGTGWAESVYALLDNLYNGQSIEFDYSHIRKAGTILKKKGGVASGPEPLQQLHNNIKLVFQNAKGRKLTSIEVYDVFCLMAAIVQCGGVRRTALICLFDFFDNEMLNAKQGNFWEKHKHRAFCNNSVVITENVSKDDIAELFNKINANGTGEPGIVSRIAAVETKPFRRSPHNPFPEYGTNPCGEIVLLSEQFCNLTSVLCRKNDTMNSLIEKIHGATIIGTFQAMATNFAPLKSPMWKKNAEQERLLGVDLNGIRDCPLFTPGVYTEDEIAYSLQFLRRRAIMTAYQMSVQLGCNFSAAVTTVKPSGNSSCLADCSAGLHPRWSEYYIRRVRLSTSSPIFSFCKEKGLPWEMDCCSDATAVISIPCKSPEGSLTRNHLTALDQLKYWKLLKCNFTEHNPSVSITFKPHELGDFVREFLKMLNIAGGITLYPAYDAVYPQAPYEEISKSEYEKMVSEFPNVDFTEYATNYFNYSSHTEESKKAVASDVMECVGGQCELKH